MATLDAGTSTTLSTHAQHADAELQPTMGWIDGATLGLSAPASVFAAVGFSVAALGGWWSMGLWAAAAVLAALATRIYSEVAAMFPDKSGGIGMYAEEGWRRYSTLVGPVATWGYWLAWSSGVAVFSGLIASILQAEFFSGQDWSVDAGVTTLNFSKIVAVAIVIGAFLVNIRGVKLAVRWAYVTGVVSLLVLLMMSIVPILTGDLHTSRIGGHLGASGIDAFRVGLVWIFVMFWTTGGIEMAASFTPEFRNGWRDTRKALLVISVISTVCLALIPMSIAGVLGEEAIANDPSGFMVPVFHEILPTASWIPTLVLCADFLLVIIAGDADGSRALFGMAKDRMTLRQFERVNRFGVPSIALTASLVFNLFLVIFVSNTLSIIAAANLGYVLAHFFAISGFLLLRKDRPGWVRPMRLGPVWIPIAFVMAVVLLASVVFGATGFSVTGYGSVAELLVAIGLLVLAWVFFFVRRLVQDKTPIAWRERMPVADPAVAASAATSLASE